MHTKISAKKHKTRLFVIKTALNLLSIVIVTLTYNTFVRGGNIKLLYTFLASSLASLLIGIIVFIIRGEYSALASTQISSEKAID